MALLGKLPKTSGEFLYDAFFPGAQAREIDLWRGKFNSPVLRLLGLFNQLGDVKKRLRRNAATVKADPARIQFGIDQRDLHAQVGGEESGGVAAGAAANHGDTQRLGLILSFIRHLV
jgi:hypothetical protein